jgi:hypothetical protein
MVGGRARSRAPRDLARDPDHWPDADLTGPDGRPSGEHVAATAVQHIARELKTAITEQQLTLRGLATASGVNRQAIADLLAGRSWPDVATIARLQNALSRRLWP